MFLAKVHNTNKCTLKNLQYLQRCHYYYPNKNYILTVVKNIQIMVNYVSFQNSRLVEEYVKTFEKISDATLYEE